MPSHHPAKILSQTENKSVLNHQIQDQQKSAAKSRNSSSNHYSLGVSAFI
jgi:hypothetical protein